ncbi:hypothetical protein [Curtanaerobium respiraculi]|uniref:hypothetical protein n=1 Tax=Curtanaerobium respiraculi TaxID=2949669 RepID=UPI0024B33EFF|nr:hypothetical protein [Curtanaerobium respiraculi]
MPVERTPENLEQALKDFEAENGTLGLEVGAPIDDEMRQRRRRYMQEVLGFQFTTEAEEEKQANAEGSNWVEFGPDAEAAE